MGTPAMPTNHPTGYFLGKEKEDKENEDREKVWGGKTGGKVTVSVEQEPKHWISLQQELARSLFLLHHHCITKHITHRHTHTHSREKLHQSKQTHGEPQLSSSLLPREELETFSERNVTKYQHMRHGFQLFGLETDNWRHNKTQLWMNVNFSMLLHNCGRLTNIFFKK